MVLLAQLVQQAQLDLRVPQVGLLDPPALLDQPVRLVVPLDRPALQDLLDQKVKQDRQAGPRDQRESTVLPEQTEQQDQLEKREIAEIQANRGFKVFKDNKVYKV